MTAVNPQSRAADPRMFTPVPETILLSMFASTRITSIVASVFSLDGRPRYIHMGWFLISVANLTVIVLMIAVFCVALVLPFPHDATVEETE